VDSSPLCNLGHVATRRDLETAGLVRREVDQLAKLDTVIRPRKGLYICGHLADAERIAAHVGARLDCVTVLKRHKIWVGHSAGLHLRMPSDSGAPARARLAAVLRRFASAGFGLLGASRITVHWSSGTAAELGARLEVPVMDALRQAMRCLPPDDVVAALESALHLKEISEPELERLIREAPHRMQTMLAQVTPGAQSGYETKARLGFQRLGHRVEIQVPVPRVGHLDIVIDGVVALEVDGKATHADTFEEDRRRDLGTELAGLRSLRIPAVWVDTHWNEVIATVERMVADARPAAAHAQKRKNGRR
jgi:hypothetical protein